MTILKEIGYPTLLGILVLMAIGLVCCFGIMKSGKESAVIREAAREIVWDDLPHSTVTLHHPNKTGDLYFGIRGDGFVVWKIEEKSK